MKKSAKLTAKDLDERFNEGEDVLDFFDTEKAEVQEPKTQRVNVDFPEWMVRRLDEEASRLGISRQSLIKFLISAAVTTRRFPAERFPSAYAMAPDFEKLFLSYTQLCSLKSLLSEEPEIRKELLKRLVVVTPGRER